MSAKLELIKSSHASCRASQHRRRLGDAHVTVLIVLATGLFPFSMVIMQSIGQHSLTVASHNAPTDSLKSPLCPAPKPG